MGTGQHPFLLPSVPYIIVILTDSSFCLATCSCWFLAWLIFDPEDGGYMFLQNVSSYMNYTVLYPRRWQFSDFLMSDQNRHMKETDLYYHDWFAAAVIAIQDKQLQRHCIVTLADGIVSCPFITCLILQLGKLDLALQEILCISSWLCFCIWGSVLHVWFKNVVHQSYINSGWYCVCLNIKRDASYLGSDKTKIALHTWLYESSTEVS
jgi:hypothetical protein